MQRTYKNFKAKNRSIFCENIPFRITVRYQNELFLIISVLKILNSKVNKVVYSLPTLESNVDFLIQLLCIFIFNGIQLKGIFLFASATAAENEIVTELCSLSFS